MSDNTEHTLGMENQDENQAIDLDSLKEEIITSDEDRDKKIKILTEELEQELTLTNSLTHLVAEKTSELDYFQNKIEEQESRIHNFEDQIEEWTTQAEACDKLLLQKDCEIEMLKKGLNIERQQRRDLEEMMMDVGKDSFKEKEDMQTRIECLQNEIEAMSEERRKEGLFEPASFGESHGNEEKDVFVEKKQTEEDERKNKESSDELLESKCEEPELRNEYKADMEELMNDLFNLIKQNEELKEEIEKLKGEQVNLLENKRNVVTELENTIEEKAAELEHQKHDFRRMSSANEIDDVAGDIAKYNQVKELKQEFERKIDYLESTNSDLKERLNKHNIDMESLSKQHSNMKKKLQMEREQNVELNKQILEVSNLYDEYFTRCEELEKGKAKGFDSPLGGELLGRCLKRNESDSLNWRCGNENDEYFGDFSRQWENGDTEEDILEEEQQEEIMIKIKAEENLGHEKQELHAKEDKTGNNGAEGSSGANLEDGDSVTPRKGKKKSSSKKKKKLKNKKNLTDNENERCSKASFVFTLLHLAVGLFKFLAVTSIVIAFIVMVSDQYRLSLQQVSSGLFVTCIFVYNIWKLVISNREISGENIANQDEGRVDHKLRRAMQDLITRLDENEFKKFGRIYDNYIAETFSDKAQRSPYGLKEEVDFLKASKDALGQELTKYKKKHQTVMNEYQEMKRDIEILKMKRIEESEAKRAVIRNLKEKISMIEGKIKEKTTTSITEVKQLSIPRKASFLKYILFGTIVSLFFVSAGDTLLFIPGSSASIILLYFMYKSDISFDRVIADVEGYKKTIQDLLRKVESYKTEEKHASNEVKELESVIDKDYETISKQRHAIERLERQLQRAISKYTEKKQILGRYLWMRERGFAGECTGFETSARKEETLCETVISEHLSVDSTEDSTPLKKEAHDNSENLVEATNVEFRSLPRQFVYFIVILTTIGAGIYGYHHIYKSLTFDLLKYPLVLAVFIAIFMLLEYVFKRYSAHHIKRYRSKIQGMQDDEAMLTEQIETLRYLLRNEREFVLKLENGGKNLSARGISKSEVDSVIDRLVEVSKQRDELKFEADDTKSKYDNVKRTLEDILSREIYLSEEVSSLRLQKRELRNDLMKEQIKQIELYEDVKILRANSGEENDGYSGKEVRSSSDQIEDDLFNVSDLDREVNEEESVEEKMGITEISFLEETLDRLDDSGRRAQEKRKKRKRSQISPKESRHSSKKSTEICKTARDIESLENERTIVMDLAGEIVDKNIVAANDVNHQKKIESEDEAKKLIDIDLKKENELKENTACNAMENIVHCELKESQLDDRNRQVNDGKTERLEQLLGAKDEELYALRKFLDLKNSNRSPVNINKPESEQLLPLIKKKLKFEQIHFAEIENELQTLANEILGLREICEGEANFENIEAAEIAPQGIIRHLSEYIGLFKYRIAVDKVASVAKVNILHDKVEGLERQILSLNENLEKEKLTRNQIISDYEDEYERLENRLCEAYENIRRRLMEERAMRGQIMKQYEIEIEDIQEKAAEILQDFRGQLKHERKEKEQAEYQTENVMKKLKAMEFELKVMEETGRNWKNDAELEAMVNNQNADGTAVISEAEEKPSSEVERVRTLIESETNRRTNILREKVEQARKGIADCKNQLKDKEDVINRLRKQEMAYENKIDIQYQRMKDLENELYTREPVDEQLQENGLRNFKDGIIYELATKNDSSAWENPSTTGLVQVTRSSAGFGNASDILDFKPMPCSTENLEDSWFQIDFCHDTTIVAEAYCLCHGWLSSEACLRSWLFEGSIDGHQWHIIKKHSMDTSINERFAVASWELQENFRPFRHFRIRMTGPNSSNTSELYIGGFEVFGKVIQAPA